MGSWSHSFRVLGLLIVGHCECFALSFTDITVLDCVHTKLMLCLELDTKRKGIKGSG